MVGPSSLSCWRSPGCSCLWLRRLSDRLGLASSREAAPRSAHDELRDAFADHREGQVVKLDRDRMGGLLDLAELEVSDVMVHRTDMRSINADEPPESIVRAMIQSPHTRMPLWRGSLDNIVGVLHAKDVLLALDDAGFDFTRIDVLKIASKPWFVPDTTRLKDQLNAFLRRKSHFAIVVDEYGEVEGLLTLEDIIEEIVGEIADEHDVDVEGVKQEADGSVVVDGSVSIRDLNRALDWSLPDDEATTIAGLVIHETRSIPEEKQAFTFHGKRFVVLKRDKNRITRIRIKTGRVAPPFSPFHGEKVPEGRMRGGPRVPSKAPMASLRQGDGARSCWAAARWKSRSAAPHPAFGHLLPVKREKENPMPDRCADGGSQQGAADEGADAGIAVVHSRATLVPGLVGNVVAGRLRLLLAGRGVGGLRLLGGLVGADCFLRGLALLGGGLVALVLGADLRHHRIGLHHQEHMLLRRQIGRLDDAALALPCADRRARARAERAVEAADAVTERARAAVAGRSGRLVEVELGLGLGSCPAFDGRSSGTSTAVRLCEADAICVAGCVGARSCRRSRRFPSSWSRFRRATAGEAAVRDIATGRARNARPCCAWTPRPTISARPSSRLPRRRRAGSRRRPGCSVGPAWRRARRRR